MSDSEYEDCYNYLQELNESVEEHPLDRALRLNDPALRCFYYENGRSTLGWQELADEQKESYRRPPNVPLPELPRGTYYVINESGQACTLSEQQAAENCFDSFCSA